MSNVRLSFFMKQGGLGTAIMTPTTQEELEEYGRKLDQYKDSKGIVGYDVVNGKYNTREHSNDGVGEILNGIGYFTTKKEVVLDYEFVIAIYEFIIKNDY
ncbi:hypothetical protein RZE82_07095 [Mollicutes bacterium LVI A0039]|nr:hypothetical protein RZE82_07095 [Mollicutes bacterium LVI A0039]